MDADITSREFRLGLIGTGVIGEQHLRAAAELPGVTVAAVCDVDITRVRSIAATHQAESFIRWQDLLEQAQVDAVIVSLPHSMHAEVTIAAAGAGLHVLVEKPMATSVADCEAMIRASEMNEVALGVCHVLHHPRRLRVAKEMITSGELGDLVTINVRRSTHYARPSRPRWFFDATVAGGGIMFNLGAHAVDLVQWLGGAAVARVAARTMTSDPDLGVETDAVALVELANGVPASVITMGSAMPTQDDLDVVGTRGVLTSSHRDGLLLYRAGQAEQVVAPEADLNQAFRALLADFVDAARIGRAPLTDGHWGRAVVAAVTTVYASQEQGGGWVPVPKATPA